MKRPVSFLSHRRRQQKRALKLEFKALFCTSLFWETNPAVNDEAATVEFSQLNMDFNPKGLTFSFENLYSLIVNHFQIRETGDSHEKQFHNYILYHYLL